ncbi:hypothetical protein [uncultured Rikenella sp.]|uniref:hypothetical protein n=1 Tax=uncultured Rikenella sp. TaxID=368003 RepID=UPI0026355C02|nr:hypothetical protein [uncultured Rikenella sp.]
MNRARYTVKLNELPDELRQDVWYWVFSEKCVPLDPRTVIISGLEVYTYQPGAETLRGCLERLEGYRGCKDTVNGTKLAEILGVSRHTVRGFVHAGAIKPQSRAEWILNHPEGEEYAAYFRRWERAKKIGGHQLLGCDNFRDWVKAHKTLHARRYYNLGDTYNDLTEYIAEKAAGGTSDY